MAKKNVVKEQGKVSDTKATIGCCTDDIVRDNTVKCQESCDCKAELPEPKQLTASFNAADFLADHKKTPDEKLQLKIDKLLNKYIKKFVDKETKTGTLYSELKRAGLFDKDSDYGGMLGTAVMKLALIHSFEGHSGFSHNMAVSIFRHLESGKTLTPLTNDPDEWADVSSYSDLPADSHWQNKRMSSAFSDDKGNTYYDINEKPTRSKKVERNSRGQIIHRTILIKS